MIDHPPLVLGMPLDVAEDSAMVTGQPLSGFVVVKAMNPDGRIAYCVAATDGLMAVECLGMAEYAALKLRNGLISDTNEEDDPS